MKTKRRTLFIGILLSENKTKMELQVTETKDGLSCEIYDWYEVFSIKKEIHLMKNRLLNELQSENPKLYGNVKSVIVT